MEEKTTSKVGLRMWLIIIFVGLAGQFAWSIENMYLNSYITYLNFTSTTGSFDYSLYIAITTALSAITATVTTIFMGSLTDKIGKRKMFVSIGYLIWGIATASFGLLNVNSAQEILPIAMSASTAAILVIVIDCIMTFFGSTANDASFNSYITSHIKDEHKAKVEGVLSVLPLIAMLMIFVGLNGLTTEAGGYRWDLFFYIIGGIVFVVGLASFFLIPKEEKTPVKSEKMTKLLTYGFLPETIKNNKKLYLVLAIYFIYAVSCQVFFPYLMVYVEKTCQIDNSGTGGLLTPFAIVMAVALLGGSLGSVLLGFLADKKGKPKMIIPSLAVFFVGIFLMFFITMIEDDTLRTVFATISALIMILGYVGVPTIINSMVREYIPKGMEGSFMGVRMLFVVALPMCIGPFIGSALNNAYGEVYTSEYGVESPLPSNYAYLVGAIMLILCLIPTFYFFKELRKENTENA